MDRYKSPLRYPGGKACLAPFLTRLINQNNLSDAFYAEPFAGGAGAALELLFNEQVWKILLNDADYHIYAFWQSILTQSDSFCRKIDRTEITIGEWEKQKKIFDNPGKYSLFHVGFSTFYLNRTNRSGILRGSPIGGFDQTGKWKIDARFNKAQLISRIQKITRYKNRIEVFNLEAKEFLTYLDSIKEKVLVYLDPPYYKQGPALYLNFYNHADHEALSEFIKTKLRHPWVLSYDNVRQIETMYRELQPHKIELSYHANESKKGSEILFFSPLITDLQFPVQLKY